MIRIQRLALTAVIFGLFTACAGESIPRRVLAGSTFVMPFVVSTIAYSVDPTANPGTILTLPDPQRGRSRFVLCQNNCAQQVNLITRYVGSLAPDRGSKTGLSGMAELIPEGGTTAFPLPDVLTSQPILIADVPVTTAGGTYSVVYFRDPPGPDPEIGTTLDGSIEIVAVPAGTPPSFTDIKRVLNFGNSSATPTLQGLIPYPQLEIALADEGNMDDRPAGGSLQITVPPNVEIQSVFESRTLGQTSMVRFVKNMDSNGVTTSIAVSYVDIDRKIRRLRIAFSLTGTNPSPVVPSAFPITSQKLYRLNGTLLPDTDVVNAVGNKFVLGSIS